MVDNQKRKRIGFVSYWGFGRGQANVTRMYVKMLKDNYDIFILKQFDNPIEDEFKFDDVKITEHSEYSISHPFFKKWITDNKLDAVVFNEYNQWSSGVNDLIPIAHELGVKVYGYLVWEKYRNNEDYEPYDRIWCPTKSFCRFMRTHRFRKFTYIPYSVDLDEYPIVEKSRDKDKFVFFHPGGWGGVHNRKNTENVLKAFNKLQQNKDNCKLIITSQRKIEINNLPDNVELVNKNLTRDELIKYYQNCDCMVMPSKWDTVGISCLTANTPIYTSTGIKPIHKIVKGDCVLTNNGFFKKVTKTMNRSSNDLYELEPAYSNKIVITGNHPVLGIKTNAYERQDKKGKKKQVRNYSKLCNDKSVQWINVENLVPYDFLAIPKPKHISKTKYLFITDYIKNKKIINKNKKICLSHSNNMKNIKKSGYDLAKKYKIPKSIVYRILNNVNTRQKRKVVNKIQNEYGNYKLFIPNKIKITAEFCKLIGYYIAEGWTTGSNFGFAFHSNETKYQNFVLNAIKNIFGVSGHIKIQGNKAQVLFSNALVGNFLQQLCGHLAKNKHIPKELLHISPSLQYHILIGYFNGDGHIHNNRMVSATTVSKTLAYDIKYLLLRQGVLSRVKKYERNPHIRFDITVALSKKSIKLFNLKSKKPRYNFYFEDDKYFYVRVKKNKKLNQRKQVYNLEVEDNHTYCGEIIYHNCLEAMAFGKPVITTDSPPMNEFITSGTTGYLCTPEFEDYDDISVMAACVDETEIFKQMNNSMAVPELTTLMGKNARKIIENKYDLDKNKHLLIDFLEAELNGRE